MNNSNEPTDEELETIAKGFDEAQLGSLARLTRAVMNDRSALPQPPARPAGEAFNGVVTDAGGGMVDIQVDRDTESYPAVGQAVHVSSAPSLPTGEVEEILDKHAEYYIRQTMKFFQNKGESPALSKDNEGDLEAKAAIDQHYNARFEAALGRDEYITERDRIQAVRSLDYNRRANEIKVRWYAADGGQDE